MAADPQGQGMRRRRGGKSNVYDTGEACPHCGKTYKSLEAAQDCAYEHVNNDPDSYPDGFAQGTEEYYLESKHRKETNGEMS